MSPSIMDNHKITVLRESLASELNAMLGFWQSKTPDREYGGFVGQIDGQGITNHHHPKGIILNTRILWTFSRANIFYGDDRYEQECLRAFDYLVNHFQDKDHGGFFWELDHLGNPTNKRKQVYAQAFAIYAFSAYYQYCGKQEVLDLAFSLFRLIEDKAWDHAHEGYFEAFGETWEPIEDMRLSDKDLNTAKSTNTHLHVLEAYTSLLEVSGDSNVHTALSKLISLFDTQMIDHDNHHLKLFFDTQWQAQSSEISFGHDIETVWLLLLAARVLGSTQQIKRCEDIGKEMADIFLIEALDQKNGVLNAYDPEKGEWDTDLHWWPQIEAMTGLGYLWDLTGEARYLEASTAIWDFTQAYIIDHERGEWFFRVSAQGQPYLEEDKVGPWKCPYHNGRGLMEMLGLLDKKNR